MGTDFISQGGDDQTSNLGGAADLMYQSYLPRSNYSLSVKQRFLYKPFMPLPNLQDYLNEIIEVRVYKEYLTKFNKAYIKRIFYGQDIYTSDSDAVCILQHVGAYAMQDSPPTDFEAIAVYFRVVKGRNNYTST